MTVRVDGSNNWAEVDWHEDDMMYITYGANSEEEGTTERLGHFMNTYPETPDELREFLMGFVREMDEEED